MLSINYFYILTETNPEWDVQKNQSILSAVETVYTCGCTDVPEHVVVYTHTIHLLLLAGERTPCLYRYSFLTVPQDALIDAPCAINCLCPG